MFLKADSMYKNLYEGLATREDMEDALREVEKLVSAIAKIANIVIQILGWAGLRWPFLSPILQIPGQNCIPGLVLSPGY